MCQQPFARECSGCIPVGPKYDVFPYSVGGCVYGSRRFSRFGTSVYPYLAEVMTDTRPDNGPCVGI
jgi:hypothetical protein